MKVKLPSGWSQIEIGKFPIIYDILKDEDIEPVDKQVRIISVVTGLNVSVIECIELESLRELVKKIQFVFSLEMPKPVHSFKHCGYTWMLNYDVTKLTAGEFISISKMNETEDSTINNFSKIAAIFCKPYKRKLFWMVPANLNDEQKTEMLSTAKVGTIYPMCVFFCKVLKDLYPAILDYLKHQRSEVLKMIESELKRSMKNIQSIGVGT